MFGKSFWHYRNLNSECWTSGHILCKKILKFLYVWKLEFFVKKCNMYEAHIFPRPLQQTRRLETSPLCLNTRLRVKKNFKNHINFFEFNVNVCLLCAHHVMTSIILHTRRPNCQKCLLRTLFLCFSWLSFFAFWEAEKHVFHITPFRPPRYVLMRLKWLEVSNRVRNWNKVKKFIFV